MFLKKRDTQLYVVSAFGLDQTILDMHFSGDSYGGVGKDLVKLVDRKRQHFRVPILG
jgi:hypothetical protein